MLLAATLLLLLRLLPAAVQALGAAQCNELSPSGLDVSNFCIGCICEASTKCNQTIGCIQSGQLCGPFLISRAFWLDSGRCVQPGDSADSPGAFERCAQDIECSSRIIRSYMYTFAKDCNGDQVITCEDYTMIHKNGGYQCGSSIADTEYWSLFSQCRDLVIQSGSSV